MLKTLTEQSYSSRPTHNQNSSLHGEERDRVRAVVARAIHPIHSIPAPNTKSNVQSRRHLMTCHRWRMALTPKRIEKVTPAGTEGR